MILFHVVFGLEKPDWSLSIILIQLLFHVEYVFQEFVDDDELRLVWISVKLAENFVGIWGDDLCELEVVLQDLALKLLQADIAQSLIIGTTEVC